MKTKETVLLILSEVSNNFNVYNYTSTTILQSQNITICGFIFLVTWQICFLKMETINCHGVKKWVNDKTKLLVKVMNCFRVWTFELPKNRYRVFENLVFKLICLRKGHMWGSVKQCLCCCKLLQSFYLLLIFTHFLRLDSFYMSIFN